MVWYLTRLHNTLPTKTLGAGPLNICQQDAHSDITMVMVINDHVAIHTCFNPACSAMLLRQPSQSDNVDDHTGSYATASVQAASTM